MMRCVGWKRLEVNTLLKFSNVTPANFGSIYRRGLVWRAQGTFIERSILEQHHKEAHVDGVFPCDDELRNFLVSPPAVAAGMAIQHGFEEQHNASSCRQMIENYVVKGGDHGLTEKWLRKSCGIATADEAPRTGEQRALDILAGIDLGVEELGRESATDSDETHVENARAAMLRRDMYSIGQSVFLQIKSSGTSKAEKTEIWHRLVGKGLFIPTCSKGRSGSSYLPTVSLSVEEQRCNHNHLRISYSLGHREFKNHWGEGGVRNGTFGVRAQSESSHTLELIDNKGSP